MNAVTEIVPELAAPPRWRARLCLAFERRGARTVLAGRSHVGPLVVQRALYPEGETVCHTILVHPPAGIAGGDELEVEASLGSGAHVLLTTPGAGKWYRSAGPRGALTQRIAVAAGAVCEWLPQESIVYNGACGTMRTEVSLSGDACFIGAEMLCFGRTGAGERFSTGELAMHTRITRAGRAVWLERGQVAGGSALLDSMIGLQGAPVSATLLVASPRVDRALLDAWRALVPAVGSGGVTLLPELLVARYLGPACEPARNWFTALWSAARPAVAGRAMQIPRIWNT